MRHMVDAIAAQGRNGDDELLHVSKQELRDLKTIGNAIGIRTTVNPRTGIHEAFNWGKMLATGAGGTVGFVASGFNPLGAAAGAALASGAYTAAEGGSTMDVLTNAAISGATAYAGAGIAQGLGEAGQAATQAGTQELTQGGTQALADTGTQAGIQSLSSQGTQQSAQVAGNLLPQTATGEGSSQGVGSVVGDKFVPNPTAPAPQMSPQVGSVVDGKFVKPDITGADIARGFEATSGKDLMSQYGLTAAKTGVGLATLGALPTTSDQSDTTSGTGMNYRAETYVTPDGQRRTRAVPLAGGGGVGIASMARGRYLQGPGDGMSDSIPARIDGGQEARLATGEFVVPADVVSHLGNGDSDSGAKQLHTMMDRVRMARTGTKKQGKQVNPRKLMPA